EPPLVAASTWYIASLSALGERAAGAYLGLAANGSYGLAWLAESYEWWARRAAGGAVKAPQNGERERPFTAPAGAWAAPSTPAPRAGSRSSAGAAGGPPGGGREPGPPPGPSPPWAGARSSGAGS